jgi:hypothetical protein
VYFLGLRYAFLISSFLFHFIRSPLFLTVDVGEATEERPNSRGGGGDSAGESEGESDGDNSEGDDQDDDNEEDGEEYGDDDDDDDPRGASSRSSNGHRLSHASAMSSNGSVTSNNGGGGTSSSPSGGGPASLDARAQLAANLLLLQGTELGHIIMTLERECPAALEVNDSAGQHQQQHDGSVNNSNGNTTTKTATSNGRRTLPEKLEIVLDVLEGPLFTKIATYASERATIRKRGMMAAAAAAGGSAGAAAAASGDITINDISNKRRRR